MDNNYTEKINKMIKKLKLDKNELNEFNEIIHPIINSDEFQKRLTDEYMHHDDLSVGEHILEVALRSYKKALKKKCDVKVTIYIAMFHDLYTEHWQNNPQNQGDKFYNKHGFRHPIEAIINAITWFPQIFNDENKNIIIDGVIHHMWPLPVRAFDEDNMQLRNKKLFDQLDENYKSIIKDSLSRKNFLKVSWSRSKYKEGRIICIQDKIVSCFSDLSLEGYKSCITGHNKKAKKKNSK